MLAKNLLVILLLFVTESLFGQARSTPTATPAPRDNQATASETATLKKEIADLKQEIDDLKIRIELLETGKVDVRGTAFLDTSLRGYERIDTTSGSFLVALDEVTPYLDGFKAKLKIGNLTTAAHDGFKLNLRWFPHDKYRPMKSKEQEFTQCLSPSTWNPVEVILPNTKPEELGKLWVSMETSTVSFLCK